MVNPSNAPGIKAASGIADTGAIEGHVDKFVFHPGFAGFVGVGELENMGTGRATIAGMTGSSLAVTVDVVRLAAWTINGSGSHRNVEFKKRLSYTAFN